ncbi:MAG: hypothetical protein IPK82_43670 [Polyangiaceae bacterium]|nr:hypothetical protein [Polyangiaceae bacterium]
MGKLGRWAVVLGAALTGAAAVVGCAEAITIETGGAGGTDTTSSTGGSTTSSTSTGVGGCTGAQDCVSFGDACNEGACINGECGKLPAMDGAACDDGKQCTQNDYCDNGACVAGTTKPCAASDPCKVAVCDPVSDTCVENPGNNGTTCFLSDPCVAAASCINGTCQPKQAVDCSFLTNECGVGFCDSAQGGCTLAPKMNGTPCNDFKYCTVQDQCVDGQCKGYPNTCGVISGDPCKVGICSEAQQTCISVAGNDGAACDDKNLCTAGETCFQGKCLGGMPANNGAVCDDANGCTGGTTCSNGACAAPTSEITQCVDGDMCCPAGCANDKDCLYWKSGPQVDVPEGELVGWNECYSGNYDSFDSLSTILQNCDAAKLLLACRPAGDVVFSVVAMGLRDDVLFDCGQSANCSHDANGVAWYYSGEYSWGFAPASSPVNRNSCDIVDSLSYPGGGASDGDQRICWHTGGNSLSSGWRCGKDDFIGFNYERVIFEAN